MKRIITFVLAFVILLGCCPLSAQAAQTTVGMPSIGAGGYKTMTSSQKLIDMIKVMEGFSANAYWDVSQWTIGFGSYAGSSSSGNKPTQTLTPAQAEDLLKTQLREGYTTSNGRSKGYEQYVNDFCKKIGKQPTQYQFDALVSFTYNLGAAWMNGSRLATWLKNPTTEMELVNAMGQWVRADGTILYSLVQRRVREAVLFTKGIYSLPYTPTAQHNVQSNIQVISNNDMPFYGSVIYQYDYTYNGHGAGTGHGVQYFAKGGTYSGLEIPSRAGYTFSGWKITRINNAKQSAGVMVDASTVVQHNLELTAVWTAGTGGSIPDYPPIVPPTPEPPVDGLPFIDILPEDWYVEDLKYVYNRGYMKGTSENTFEPETAISRGMLVTILYRIEGEPSVTDEQRRVFDDIANNYYTDAVAWARANGIVFGITEREFCPNEDVTRQQAVSIFYRYCVEYKGKRGSGSNDLSGFADKSQLQSYSLAAMQWAVGNGVISGTPNLEGLLYLEPEGWLTRCQAAAIIRRCATQILGMS